MSREIPYGHKRCRHCNEIVRGLRTLVCPHCEGDLAKQVKPGEPEAAEKGSHFIVTIPDGYRIPEDFRLRRIHTPAGPCPLRFASAENGLPSEDEIAQWAMSLRQHMIDLKGQWFSNSALAYWAVRAVNKGERFHPASTELEMVRKTIANLPDVEQREIKPYDDTAEMENDSVVMITEGDEVTEDGWF